VSGDGWRRGGAFYLLSARLLRLSQAQILPNRLQTGIGPERTRMLTLSGRPTHGCIPRMLWSMVGLVHRSRPSSIASTLAVYVRAPVHRSRPPSIAPTLATSSSHIVDLLRYTIRVEGSEVTSSAQPLARTYSVVLSGRLPSLVIFHDPLFYPS
jgi:hypothetical protein